MKTRLKLWTAAILCVCAVLLCGVAVADAYNLHVEDFGDRVMPYCEQFVLIAGYNQVYNEADIAVDGDNTSMTIAAARQVHPRRY